MESIPTSPDPLVMELIQQLKQAGHIPALDHAYDLAGEVKFRVILTASLSYF